MKLTITKIDQVLFSGEADSVSVPGVGGMMTVLGHHMPIVSPLQKGTIVVKRGETEDAYEITSGILEVGKMETTILL